MIGLCKLVLLLMVIYSFAIIEFACKIPCKAINDKIIDDDDSVFNFNCSSLNVSWSTLNTNNIPDIDIVINIDLSNNSFYMQSDGVIKDYGFFSLGNLKYGLYLRSNKFKIAGENAFNRNITNTTFELLQVKLIDLSYNEFERFPMEALIKLNKLQELDLSFNPINSIELDDSLTNEIENNNKLIPFASLTKLNIRNCNLSYLNLTIFELLFKNLKYLDVSNNNLFALESRFMDLYPLASSFNLKIDKNPLYCDCKLLWLKKYLIATNQISNATQCMLNHDGFGQNKYPILMTELNDEQFICEFNITLTKIDTNQDDKVTLRCNVTSYPEPLIVWKYGSKSLPKTSDLSDNTKYVITDRVLVEKPSADFKDKQLYHAVSILTINSVDNLDSGNYSCSVSFLKKSLGSPVTGKERRFQERLNHTSQKSLYLQFAERPNVNKLLSTVSIAIRVGSSTFFKWLLICVCVTVSLIILVSVLIFFIYRCRQNKKKKKMKEIDAEKYEEIQEYKIREHDDTPKWKTYSARRNKSTSSSHDESKDEDAISSIYAPNGHNINEEQSSDTDSDNLDDYLDPALVNLR